MSSLVLLAATSTSLAACEHRGPGSDQVKAKPSKAAAAAKPATTPPAATPPAATPPAATPPAPPAPPLDGNGDVPAGAAGSVRAPTADDLATYTKDLPGKGDKLFADIETTNGKITCELYGKERPITVANFIGLATGKHAWRNPKTGVVEQGKPYFDGLTFHRVMPNFMIQGGDPLGTGTGGPGYAFVDEFGGGLSNTPGTLAMANAGPTTNGSQFFINVADNSRLDPKHTVFGLCAPLDVAVAITQVEKNGTRPVTPVVMTKVTIRRGK